MDPIADMLTIIRNAQSVKKRTVKIPFSRLKLEIARVLEREGFLEKVAKKGKGTKKLIEIKLKYQNKQPLISGLQKISKPGQPIYVGARHIRPVRNGYGIAVISTSRGLMTDKEARKQKIGGEIICKVW
jgi:small subunit ribosomal protein S8